MHGAFEDAPAGELETRPVEEREDAVVAPSRLRGENGDLALPRKRFQVLEQLARDAMPARVRIHAERLQHHRVLRIAIFAAGLAREYEADQPAVHFRSEL